MDQGDERRPLRSQDLIATIAFRAMLRSVLAVKAAQQQAPATSSQGLFIYVAIWPPRPVMRYDEAIAGRKAIVQ
jgi:hypothetical protein